jgi:uncharacterized repeat protein (TIGR03803 family)
MSRTRTRVLFGVSLLLVAAASTIAARAQTYKDAYEFGSHSGDPLSPAYGLVAQGRDGNLYSTSPSGGTGNSGTVFKITPAGVLTVLYNFDVTHGSYAYGGLTLGTDGNFYGTAYQGGAGGRGTVYKVTPTGTLTVLHDFASSVDGGSPYAAPVQGTDGNFYGTTYNGGSKGYGTVYKMTPAGTLTVLYPFDHTHGGQPDGPLVQGTDGKLYGVTYSGGTNGYGTLFKVSTGGVFTGLYNFDSTHGSYPYGALVQGTDGSFYGTTYNGGSGGGGVVFKITASGVLTVLHNLTSSPDGAGLFAGLTQVNDGSFYGPALRGGAKSVGTIYRITTKGAFSVLYNFDRPTGSTPEVTLLEHTTGILYGETLDGGGSHNDGVFYSFKNGLKPFVRLLPTSGKVGKSIDILGQGFNGTTGVSFNGTTATFNISSDTYLIAKVPAGATTGTVTVTESGGKLTSNQKFRVTPVIKTFNPTSGPVGTPVTITGVSLTQTSKVTFGAVKATNFTADSDTQVTATVPVGAITGKIAITTPGGAATSSGVFTVTP